MADNILEVRDLLCCSPHPEAFFTAPNSPRHHPSLAKLVCDVFESKTSFNTFFRRRVHEGNWISEKFEDWSFELMNERAPQLGIGSLIRNKRVQLGLGKPSRPGEPDLWGLVLNNKVPIPVNGNMHMQFQFAAQQAEFLVGEEVFQISFRLELEFQDFCQQFFSCCEKNSGDTSELLTWVRNSNFHGVGGRLLSRDSVPAQEKFSLRDDVPANVTSISLSRRAQSLVMGVQDHDFVIGSDSISILRKSATTMKLQSELARLTEHRDSQRAAILLHDEKTLILMRTSQACPQADSVNQLDVITREVVRCWSLEKDCTRIKARKLCNVAKQPDSLSESSFFTLDHSRISQWDIRVPRGIVEEYDAMKYVCGSQYASKQRFQCIAVDGDGDVALGSEDGVISLYSAGVLSRAKVKLPKLKGSIRNLDVTYSGNLLLATLDHELVLMCTSFNDKEGRLKSAFKSTGLKGSTTTTPILLRLKAIDASIFLTGHTLHDGRFSWIGDKSESYIVASGGHCTFVWSLNRVADATHDCYKICSDLKICFCYCKHSAVDTVVDASFQHWREGRSVTPSLVVSTPFNVAVV